MEKHSGKKSVWRWILLTCTVAIVFAWYQGSRAKGIPKPINHESSQHTSSQSSDETNIIPIQRRDVATVADWSVNLRYASSPLQPGEIRATCVVDGFSGQSFTKVFTPPASINFDSAGVWNLLITGDGITPIVATLTIDPEKGVSREVITLIPTGGLKAQIANPSPTVLAAVEKCQVLITRDTLLQLPLLTDDIYLGPGLSRVASLAFSDLFALLKSPSSKMPENEEFEKRFRAITLAPEWRLLKESNVPFASEIWLEKPFDDTGQARFKDLPAMDGYRWRVQSKLAFKVEPTESRRLSAPGQIGFKPKPASDMGFVMSAPFAIQAGLESEYQVQVFDGNGFKGQLDYSLCGGSQVRGYAKYFSILREQDASGETLISFQPEAVLVPDEAGHFSLEGTTPGEKELSMVWWDENGDYFIARREFTIQQEDLLDFGLIQPIAETVLRIKTNIVNEDGQEIAWSSLFPEQADNQGAVSVTIKNKDTTPLPGGDIWENIYSNLENEIELHGLPIGQYAISLLPPGSTTAPWPTLPLGYSFLKEHVRERIFFEGDFSITNSYVLSEPSSMVLNIGGLTNVHETDKVLVKAKGVNLLTGKVTNDYLWILKTPTGWEAQVSKKLLEGFLVLTLVDGVDSPRIGWMNFSDQTSSSPGVLQLEMKPAIPINGIISSELRSKLPSKAVQFDVEGWPGVPNGHFFALPDANGRFQISAVPAECIFIERSLGISVVGSADVWRLGD